MNASTACACRWSIDSIAQVLIAGRSTFQMTYQDQSINGRPCRRSQADTLIGFEDSRI